MECLGLRISECVIVNLRELDFDKRTVRRWNCKKKEWKIMPMPPKLYDELQGYLREYGDEVRRHGGYLIYNRFRPETAKNFHLSIGNLRTVFKRYLRKAGLDDCYIVLKSGGNQPGKTRTLTRLCPHSFRHYFGAQVYKRTKDIVLTSKLMDHSRLDVTMTYMDSVGEKMTEAMNMTFGNSKGPEIDIQEFMNVYQMYQRMKAGV